MISVEKCDRLVQILKEKELTIGSAESFTGGLFASSLVGVPGVSSVFKGSLVTYSPLLKTKYLGVSACDIEKLGVVSQKVANDMAMGARKELNVDVAVSFTGNAGPDAEPGRAKVGRVYMAISTRFGLVELPQDFIGSRNEIRERAVDMMLDYLIAILA